MLPSVLKIFAVFRHESGNKRPLSLCIMHPVDVFALEQKPPIQDKANSVRLSKRGLRSFANSKEVWACQRSSSLKGASNGKFAS